MYVGTSSSNLLLCFLCVEFVVEDIENPTVIENGITTFGLPDMELHSTPSGSANANDLSSKGVAVRFSNVDSRDIPFINSKRYDDETLHITFPKVDAVIRHDYKFFTAVDKESTKRASIAAIKKMLTEKVEGREEPEMTTIKVKYPKGEVKFSTNLLDPDAQMDPDSGEFVLWDYDMEKEAVAESNSAAAKPAPDAAKSDADADMAGTEQSRKKARETSAEMPSPRCSSVITFYFANLIHDVQDGTLEEEIVVDKRAEARKRALKKKTGTVG